MAEKRVVRALFRALARAVEPYDGNPALRALLTSMPDRVFHRALGRVVDVTSSSSASSIVDHAIRTLNGGAEYYRPRSEPQPLLARVTLSSCFRSPPVTAASTDEVLDGAFEALRWLEAVRDSFARLPAAEWTSVSVPKLALSPDQAAMPRVGDLLLTHPVACPRQPTLHQAAILLTEAADVGVEEKRVRGVTGIVLNRPSRLTLGQLLQAHGANTLDDDDSELPSERARRREPREPDAARSQADDVRALLAPISHNLVYVGGDVMRDRLLLLHPYPHVRDSARVCDGVYVCSNAHAVHDAITSGEAHASAFKVMVGHCGWAAEQLQVECERGVWFVTRDPEGEGAGAIAELATRRHCVVDDQDERAGPSGAVRGDGDDADGGSGGPWCAASMRELLPMQEETHSDARRPQYLESADRAMYCGLLTTLSPEHAELCQLACDADTLLEHLHETVERHHEGLEAALAQTPSALFESEAEDDGDDSDGAGSGGRPGGVGGRGGVDPADPARHR